MALITSAIYVRGRVTTTPSVAVATVQRLGGGGEGSSRGLTANGYIVARSQASVSSSVTGRLAYLGVAEGSTVHQGEIIARLENHDARASVAQTVADSARAEAAVREAEAASDPARRDLARAQSLFAQRMVSEQQVQDLESQVAVGAAHLAAQRAAVASAAAAVGVARANLENTSIRAPFDGTVLRKEAELGEIVSAMGTGAGLTRGAVVTMADLNSLEVEVNVEESAITQVRDGGSARITVDAKPDHAYRGKVREILPTADRQRGTVLVKVSLLDRDPQILPEMAARVQFLNDSNTGRGEPLKILVPTEAVRTESGQTVVWTVTAGRLHRIAVVAGAVAGVQRIILAGLSGGEQVVTSSAMRLVEGAAVKSRAP